MAKKLQLRGGTTSEHSSFTGDAREVTVNTTLNTLVIHDGSTAGGHALPRFSDVALTGIDDNATSVSITIDSSENVGIKNTTPTTPLDVTGTVKATAFVGDGSALTGVSSVSETQVTPSSGGQTAFTFSYDVGRLMIFMNGVKLYNTVDFTATNGTGITFTTGVQTTDKLEFVKF